MIRLYPVIYRYLEGNQRFQKYQWVTAQIEKSAQDDRPESYKILPRSISLGPIIGSSHNWRDRKQWVLFNENIFQSLESLSEAQEKRGTSLGVIKPKKIIKFTISRKTNEEIKEAENKKNQIMIQLELFGEKKNLELIPVRFNLHFSCDDPRCSKPHKISILDWEFGELYRRLHNKPEWEKAIKMKVDEICAPTKDTYLFMGNMIGRPQVFCILGFFWPRIEIQKGLF
ncbi:MAG: hypothetical protein ABSH06_18770 [Thermodesulfobacteriota bacterium]